MSGHSKWKTIKHQKGVADVRRGALFTKLSRDIALAVRAGGGIGDPDMNFRLRLAVDKAKAASMPFDNIQRAIKRGAGEGGDGAEQLEELTYEGYGPGGTAIMLEVVTTNRNRTAAEVRSVFNKAGGSLGESGCVAWNFEYKGVISLEEPDESKAEEIVLLAIDAGADDVKMEDGEVDIYTAPDKLQAVQAALKEQGLNVDSAELAMVPKTTVMLEPHAAHQNLRLLDQLEELSDIQKAYSNADFPPEALEEYQNAF